MNRSFRIGAIAVVTALGAVILSTAGLAGAAQPFVKAGVINACVKMKGKNRGALRVVAGKRGCKRLRGWRRMSWSANGPSGQGGATGNGERGPQGEPGPSGQQGTASQVEKSLIETVQTQSAQINALTAELADLTSDLGNLEGSVGSLSGDVVDLEGTVGETCGQLSALTDQSDDILESLLGASIGGLVGGFLDVPDPPEPLGTFECG